MVVILIRHAERAAAGDDPALTAAGTRRAKLLATMLRDAHVSAIFISTFRRTKDTATPLAQKAGIEPTIIADTVNQAKTQILAAGPCVVVVGHSDTVPAFIQALGGPSNVQIADGEFDRMFVMSVPPTGTPAVLQMRYVL